MRPLFLLLSILFSTTTYAIFCPTNFTNIELGDSLQSVISQCGKPSAFNEYKSNGITALQWSFLIRPFDSNKGLKKLKVVFVANQVKNITIEDEVDCQLGDPACQTSQNLENVYSTQACGFPIKVGDTQQVVQVACGKPIMQQQVQLDDPSNTSTLKMAAALYEGPPRVLLIFENNVLRERRFL